MALRSTPNQQRDAASTHSRDLADNSHYTTNMAEVSMQRSNNSGNEEHALSTLAVMSAASKDLNHELLVQDATTSPSKPGLLRLPPELRLQIFELALDHDMHQRVQHFCFGSCGSRYNVPFNTSQRDGDLVPMLQMSSSNIATTCKLFANEMRACRGGLKAEKRYMELQVNIAADRYDWPFHWYTILQRLPCPVVDLTGLRINWNIYAMFHTCSVSNPSLRQGRLIARMLRHIFDGPCNERGVPFFEGDTVKLRNIEVYVQIKRMEGTEFSGPASRNQFIRIMRAYIIASLDRMHLFLDTSSLGPWGLRNVRLAECRFNDDLEPDSEVYPDWKTLMRDREDY